MENIRNFCILAHIDHGKSTLADRFLEITKTVNPRKMRPQYLDQMALERERGITIKMQPVRMEWKGYILNLIDTPGHVDFSYEVSRSLAAAEGAILLVDATQGVQAQTLSNLELAKKEKLVIIPVINKIDLSIAEIGKTSQEIEKLLGIPASTQRGEKKEEIILISAKTGENVEKVLERVIKKVSPPVSSADKPFRALIFDSEYDSYKGVIAYVRIFDGQIKKGDKIYLIQSKAKGEVLELGYFKPELVESQELKSGEIGYIATGLKNIEDCRVGDTVTISKLQTTNYKLLPLRGYKEPQSVVFASFYPTDKDDYDLLKDSLGKLKLNDASLNFSPESSTDLGRGFRCGFLGMLHLEIVSERLKRDYDLDLVITSPSVIYKKDQEPWTELEIITPEKYLGQINKLLSNFPGEFKDTEWLTKEKIVIKYQGPLDIILQGFYDKLKNVSSGYASMSYKLIGYREADLVKLDILINKEKIEAFSKIVRQSDVYKEGKKMVELLKEILPSYQWAVSIQAAVGGRIIARETKKATRKDVTGYLYGGDVTRKKKLLEKQKRGKKKLAKFGKITIPSEVFLKVLKKR
jgi:GTP-binding protein LepA